MSHRDVQYRIVQETGVEKKKDKDRSKLGENGALWQIGIQVKNDGRQLISFGWRIVQEIRIEKEIKMVQR